MHSKKSNIGMAAKAFLLTAIGLPMGVSAQGVIEEKADTIVVYPTQHLEEVVIVHQIPIVKLKTDKVTYQVSNDVESKTRSVLDILRKVPMVTVDGRNNIMVNGSAQFKVLCGRKIEYCHHSQSKTDVTQYACQSREEH